MIFEEPKVELVRIDLNSNVITTSCTSNANANPDMQACSSGSAHEGACESDADDWED